MNWLIFSILCSSIMILSFKWFELKKLKIFPIVVLNYFPASILGMYHYTGELSTVAILAKPWFPITIFMGFMLFGVFYLIGYTIIKSGITVSAIANKMSVVIPIFVSIIFYNESFTIIKTIGFALALIAIILAIYKNDTKNWIDYKNLFYPFILFLGIGTVDSILKVMQADFLSASEISIFTALSFGFSGIIGFILSILNRKTWSAFQNPKIWIIGIGLGILNYGSLYFLIMALESGFFESSIIYALNNIGILLVSIPATMLFYNEKINPVNWGGIGLAMASILLLTFYH